MKGLIDLFRIILLVFATLSDQTDKPLKIYLSNDLMG